MDVTGQKRVKTKVYDQAALMLEDQNDITETMMTDEITEEDFVEALIAEGEDSDAVLIADFEGTAQDLLQDDPELSMAFTAYTDARKRLSEKFRNRGFFSDVTISFLEHVWKRQGIRVKTPGQRGQELSTQKNVARQNPELNV